MQIIKATRRFTFLLAGGLVISCAGWWGIVSPGQPTPGRTTGTSIPGLNGSTRAARGTPAGEAYLAATFPTGAKIYLSAPKAGDVVATPWVDFRGTAPAETVITFDDEIAVAAQDGSFSARVPLIEGPNEIQCDASDLAGNEVLFSIIVVYDPGGS